MNIILYQNKKLFDVENITNTSDKDKVLSIEQFSNLSYIINYNQNLLFPTNTLETRSLIVNTISANTITSPCLYLPINTNLPSMVNANIVNNIVKAKSIRISNYLIDPTKILIKDSNNSISINKLITNKLLISAPLVFDNYYVSYLTSTIIANNTCDVNNLYTNILNTNDIITNYISLVSINCDNSYFTTIEATNLVISSTIYSNNLNSEYISSSICSAPLLKSDIRILNSCLSDMFVCTNLYVMNINLDYAKGCFCISKNFNINTFNCYLSNASIVSAQLILNYSGNSYNTTIHNNWISNNNINPSNIITNNLLCNKISTPNILYNTASNKLLIKSPLVFGAVIIENNIYPYLDLYNIAISETTIIIPRSGYYLIKSSEPILINEILCNYIKVLYLYNQYNIVFTSSNHVNILIKLI